MLQQEFEERTGLKLKSDDYTEVEEIYMNTDLDKDLFCKLWIENPTALKEIERKTVLVREWKSHATLTLLAKQDCPLWLQYD